MINIVLNMNQNYFLSFLILFTTTTVLTSELDPFDDPHFKEDRTTIVNLFEWRFDEIARECERFLGSRGYGGVLTSPVWEHELIKNPLVGNRYGLVSYKIATRYGDETQLADMVKRCNNVGVRVYVDCNVGSTTFPYEGKGFGGTPFYGANKSYPGVPYTYENFNSKKVCPTESGDIENPKDLVQLRNCMLTDLNDLNNGQEYVQNKIAEALNKLISLGIAGIRVDASYMSWPKDLGEIFKKLDNLNPKYFEPNSTLYIFHSINYEDGLPPGPGPSPYDYLKIGSIIAVVTRDIVVDSFLKDDFARIKQLRYLNEKSSIPSNSAVSFIDAPAYQFTEVPEGINFRQPFLLIKATAFLLAWPFGTALVMSSYNYTIDPAPEFWKINPMARKWVAGKAPVGPNGYSLDVFIKPDSSCSQPWICEHRWKPIGSMVKFRNVVGDAPVSNWINLGEDVIAFSRESKGFILIVNDNTLVDNVFQTGVPSGKYCDIISGEVIGGTKKTCSGRTIQVRNGGQARIVLDGGLDKIGVIAFHIESRLPDQVFLSIFK
ncbi:alpha-amylase-like [Brevipalpus obovatus]|uniref:alpha-amylase-like n=1 Tax=Brevipalpus obovatus TaxID=246614 RepID=UPI003D9E9656